MPKTRVLIVDDHAMLRSGLRMLISAEPDLDVVGEAGDLRQAIAHAATLRPDVITLDLSMPGGSGVASVERLREAAPSARVLVLTMHDDPAYVRAAVAMGAAGYVNKSAADTELITAIRAVARGRVFIDTRQGGFAEIMGAAPGDQPGSSPLSELSERERLVLIDVAQGHTSQEIADRIGLSVKTVESYRARMMHKLGLKSRADIVRLAIESGLLADPGA